MSVDLRYHVQTDTYYIQIQGEYCARLSRKIRHINTRLKHIQDEKHKQERIMLQEKRRCLLREKRQSERYVVIPVSDVPENVPARPIHDLPGQVVTATPEWYADLLGKLRGTTSLQTPEVV